MGFLNTDENIRFTIYKAYIFYIITMLWLEEITATHADNRQVSSSENAETLGIFYCKI